MNVLKFLRTKKGVSQSDIAKYLGITRQGYNHYETGQRQPDHNTLRKLSDYFNVSIDYLLGNDENPTASSSDEDLEDEIIVMNRAAKKMSPEKRKRMLSMFKLAFEEEFKDDDDNDENK